MKHDKTDNKVIGSMGLTEKGLQEFEEIWCRRNPGKSATQEQLYEYAIRTLVAVNLVYNIIENADYPQRPFHLGPDHKTKKQHQI